MAIHWEEVPLRILEQFVEKNKLGEIDTDNDGQIIIYTGLIEDVDTNLLREFTENDMFY